MMTRLQVKVCGLRDPDNIQAIARLHPPFIGFNFYPESKRFVGSDFSWKRDSSDTTFPKVIAVFVNESPERVIELMQRHAFDGVQFHGYEPVSAVETVRNALPDAVIIKAILLEDELPVWELEQFNDVVDYFLFDTKSPSFGGTGERFSWQLLESYSFDTPFFVAGGMDRDAIPALQTLRSRGLPVFGVDINSRVESAPGLKSVEKVRAVMEAV